MRRGLFAATGFAAALLGLMPGPASAHHSYAEFDRDIEVTVEGSVERVDWTNPHVLLVVRTVAGAEYRVEWWNTQRLERAGLPENPFAVGDRISLTGVVHRDPDVHMMTLLTEVRRPSDGWSWRRTWFRNNGAAVGVSTGP